MYRIKGILTLAFEVDKLGLGRQNKALFQIFIFKLFRGGRQGLASKIVKFKTPFRYN